MLINNYTCHERLSLKLIDEVVRIALNNLIFHLTSVSFSCIYNTTILTEHPYFQRSYLYSSLAFNYVLQFQTIVGNCNKDIDI
jgi:hypothetical protein